MYLVRLTLPDPENRIEIDGIENIIDYFAGIET